MLKRIFIQIDEKKTRFLKINLSGKRSVEIVVMIGEMTGIAEIDEMDGMITGIDGTKIGKMNI